MPRLAKPLTDTQIRQAKPKSGEYNLADGGGLYLRIKPSGTRQWIFNYTKPHRGSRSNLSLGLYPQISLAQARKLRTGFKELLANGIDPGDYRSDQARHQQQAHTNTFGVAYEAWVRTKESTWAASYHHRLTKAMALHALPAIGDIPLHQLTAPGVIQVLTPLAERQALESVRKLCRWINEVMAYAVNTGMVQANPLAGISKAFPAPKVRNRPSIKPDALPELLARINGAGLTTTTRCLILWLLHTMVRPIEAAAMRWDEIDEENRLWNVPAERMKKRRPHVVPLTDQMIEILETMKPISQHRPFVFPSRNRPLDHTHRDTPNIALKRMGYGGELVTHGLRSLASTALNEHGFPFDVVEAALAHEDKNTIRGVYNRAEYLEQRRVMMQWWSNRIGGLVDLSRL